MRIDIHSDVIDLRDVIARVEELEAEREDSDIPANEYGGPNDTWNEEREELATLESFLAELSGNSGDEQWRGDWYPVTLIADSYFTEYAQQIADDIGAINADASWPNSCIDWEEAASQLQMDYSSVEFDGVTYWYR